MLNMTIQAVLFDLDNTLTHRDESVRRYCERLIQHYAKQLNEHDLAKIKQIVNRIDCGGYPKKEFLTHPSIGESVAFALLREIAWNNPPSLEELTAFWFEKFGECAIAMPYAQQILEKLTAENIRIGLISNGGDVTRRNIIHGLGFEKYFEVIMSSERAGVSKPKTEIFHLTCQELGVDPKHSFYVGDHPVNDVLGAKQAGLTAVWFEGFHELEENFDLKADYQIRSLAQLEKIIFN